MYTTVSHTLIVLMGYTNSIKIMGYALFTEPATNAGDDCNACCQVAATFMQSLSKM